MIVSATFVLEIYENVGKVLIKRSKSLTFHWVSKTENINGGKLKIK